jgi:hypothetical protein
MTRAILVLVCVAILLLTLGAMRRGWLNRMARQSVLPALPPRPADLGAEVLRADGLYVGTTYSSSWQDRVVHAGVGERAAATAVLSTAGLSLDRDGASAIFVPRTAFVEARLAAGLAGKVMGEGGLLVVRWRLGEAELDTAFRADDKTTYPAWVAAINERVNAA